MSTKSKLYTWLCYNFDFWIHHALKLTIYTHCFQTQTLQWHRIFFLSTVNSKKVPCGGFGAGAGGPSIITTIIYYCQLSAYFASFLCTSACFFLQFFSAWTCELQLLSIYYSTGPWGEITSLRRDTFLGSRTFCTAISVVFRRRHDITILHFIVIDIK